MREIFKLLDLRYEYFFPRNQFITALEFQVKDDVSRRYQKYDKLFIVFNHYGIGKLNETQQWVKLGKYELIF